MFFDKPMVLHSKQADGRHWLTTFDITPLQIWPVAANHCRVGHFLATLLAAKFGAQEEGVPAEVTLTRDDLAKVPSFAKRYPELQGEAGEVRMRFVSKPGPVDLDTEDEDEDDDDPGEFITPQPPEDWKGTYDEWIYDVGRKLGVDVAPAGDEKGYDVAMAEAVRETQRRLPGLRERFMKGLDGANLGFKIALTTKNGGKEYVWVRITDWTDPSQTICILESQPRNCKGFKLGQTLQLKNEQLLDYAIGSPEKGVVEAGLTQKIAEDYGLIIP